MELPTRYTPQETEDKWYQHWLDRGYFHSTPDEREPYTIVIPPPNVTGVLHMGHMLNNTIQDILIRKARLDGKNACWVPGTDHASIATEAKVVRQLRERGITKGDLSRDEFMEHAWAWKEEYGGIILEQLKKLGASCDWDRTRFTLEDSMSRAVTRIFIDLYQKGRLYRGLRMTNWDPEAQTVLSNEEVIYEDENSKLYHVRYQVEGSDEYVVIATQRPETIMADTGLAVHPDDERYKHLHGKNVIVPLVNRPVPVIADTYVDIEFGTGALKITPAHDPNDYELGQKYGLEVIDSINLDGTLNEKAQFCVGMDRDAARKAIGKLLDEQGYLVKIEDYRTRVGRSERTNSVVEPKLTLQWFLKMDDFAATALEAVRTKEVTFYPENMWNMFYSWLKEENVRDWCISRQLWWGQRIPAWYLDGFAGEFVAHSAEEALAQAKEKTGRDDLTMADLKQDEDVVDTWFSSWLWPITVFDGFDNPDELRYYYPTQTLVTAWDIMFFWVARMIMAGYEWAPELLGEDWVKEHGRQPFDQVYFTGMVRDNKRRKMSKSLGNSPDALALIDHYGADGVRFGLLSCSSAGNDIIFDAPTDPDTGHVKNESKLCEQGRNYCNKMWNALRLIKGWTPDENAATDPVNTVAADWLEARLQQVIGELDELLAQFRFNDAVMVLYKFIW
ncbi:MAG: valine--tRNA ligase, partial [Lewinella sp.]|nr:valine--tRNA ligase [Lewinella sp.]